MGRIWTTAFWKDAVERLGTTVVSTIIGFLLAEGFKWESVTHWEFWAPILSTVAVNLLKVLLAGFASPNTGASFGTTVPGEIVKSYTNQTTQTIDGDRIGPGMPDKVLAHAGDTVAGPAAAVVTGTPVEEPAPVVQPL